MLRDGSLRHIQSSAIVERDYQGNPIRMVGVNRDVTTEVEQREQLRAANAELEAVARTDILTGCPNRLAGIELLRSEHARSSRTRSPFAILMIDLDHFKRVNDTFGHAVGDETLRRVAEVLRSSLREADTVARFGGEEFLVVLPETGPAGANRAAEVLRRAVEEDATPSSSHVTISVGVAVCGSDDDDVMKVVGRADSLLYEAKDAGRNRVAGVTNS